ncbi:MAG: Lon protease 2 [candidate division BRC1 bacterium ADurb.BinA292]|nr:MAG: Lon protease 2 [candidate division BRC1 bacterium ADurb.BinA292]
MESPANFPRPFNGDDDDMLPEYLDIPIFPLPNVTFFANTLLPLHIFEPRYRTMVHNALCGDRLIGVTLLKEGWQNDYFGRPPICKTFGVGKIIDSEQLDDGRFNIVLEGLYRVRLIEEFPTRPYRTGRVQVFQEMHIDDIRAEISRLMKELQILTRRLSRLLPASRELIQAAWAAHPHPLVVANHLASSLVIDPYDRQSILEQNDPIRRLNLILIQIRNILLQLDARQIREEVIEED